MRKTVIIAKEEAYGEVNQDLIQEEKSELPAEIKPEVGMGLVSKSSDGQEMNLQVIEVREASIVLDGNHPLAGKDLTFDLEVVEIKDTVATE
jgi:FKBP-type peptidyl-prolyl cis-trans isomerase SlpA